MKRVATAEVCSVLCHFLEICFCIIEDINGEIETLFGYRKKHMAAILLPASPWATQDKSLRYAVMKPMQQCHRSIEHGSRPAFRHPTENRCSLWTKPRTDDKATLSTYMSSE